MITYKIVKISKKNSQEVANLIYKTYEFFNARETDKKSLKQYLALIDIKTNSATTLFNRFKNSNINFGAFSNEKLIGIVRGRKNRIVSLFVDGNFHKQGIGKKLISLFERRAKKIGSKEIKIRSSLYAVNFYLKMDYKKTTGIRRYRGLVFQPLKKSL